MKVKITSESELPDEVLNPPETPDEISNKISKMLPDMKSIQKTGLIKKTDSFKESKEILTNFKTALYHLSEEAINNSNPLYSYGITTPEILKTTNLNAYEIRLEILKKAIEFEKNRVSPRNPTMEEVLEAAKRFYQFVENKKII